MKLTSLFLLAGLASASVGLAAVSPALAQSQGEMRVLVDRMQRLEQDLNTLQRQVYRGGGGPTSVNAPPAGAAGGGSGDYGLLMSRVDELEQLLRQLTGRIEEIENRGRVTAQRVDKLVEDMDFRLAQIERKEAAAPATPAGPQPGPATAGPAPAPAAGGSLPVGSLEPRNLGTIPAGSVPAGGASAQPQQVAAAGAAGAAAAGAAQRAKLPDGSPREQYDFATGLLQKGDYDGAQVALAEFVRRNDKDPLASSAQYWLGESHYARKQYKESAQAFLSGYQKYPKGAKAADSLLKLGMSLEQLKETQQACVVFRKVLAEYPNAETRIKGAAQREIQQGNCK